MSGSAIRESGVVYGVAMDVSDGPGFRTEEVAIGVARQWSACTASSTSGTSRR